MELDFGPVVTLNLGIGQQALPVVRVPITACSIARAHAWEVSGVDVSFIGVLLAVSILVAYVPVVPMTLVEAFYR